MEKFLFLFVIALCGTLTSTFNSERESRIVDGETARPHVRYVISLQKISEVNHYFRGHRCGGALITLQHAVTAASCNYDIINGTSRAINPAEYRVFSGSTNLTEENFAYFTRGISKITVHPDYLLTIHYFNDIAVIFLNQPFPAIEAIFPTVRLPTSRPDNPGAEGCFVAGWGSQNNTEYNASVTLQQVAKRPSSPSDCFSKYLVQLGTMDLTKMMCAEGVQQTHFAGCTGDIGNPLVCSGQLFGILVLSKNCTSSAEPELYTQVYNYNPWIKSLVEPPAAPGGGASTFQPGLTVLAVITFAQIIITNLSS